MTSPPRGLARDEAVELEATRLNAVRPPEPLERVRAVRFGPHQRSQHLPVGRLRELQAQGAIFPSQSDTEVNLAARKAWREGKQTRFNGMSALAIFDTKT